jgi:hypothetical protein
MAKKTMERQPLKLSGKNALIMAQSRGLMTELGRGRAEGILWKLIADS